MVPYTDAKTVYLEVDLLYNTSSEHIQEHALGQLEVRIILKLLARKDHAGLQREAVQ